MQDFSVNLDELLESLRDTIVWCRYKMSLGSEFDLLRSRELRPWSLAASRAEVVHWLASSRRGLVRNLPPQPVDTTLIDLWKNRRIHSDPAGPLGGGRLLVYEPDSSVFEQLSESETFGYVDVSDTPPWDTWVGWIAEAPAASRSDPLQFLLAWVSPSHVNLVDQGVNVNSTAAIRWLDEDSCTLRSLLQARGVL